MFVVIEYLADRWSAMINGSQYFHDSHGSPGAPAAAVPRLPTNKREVRRAAPVGTAPKYRSCMPGNHNQLTRRYNRWAVYRFAYLMRVKCASISASTARNLFAFYGTR